MAKNLFLFRDQVKRECCYISKQDGLKGTIFTHLPCTTKINQPINHNIYKNIILKTVDISHWSKMIPGKQKTDNESTMSAPAYWLQFVSWPWCRQGNPAEHLSWTESLGWPKMPALAGLSTYEESAAQKAYSRYVKGPSQVFSWVLISIHFQGN